MSKTAGLRLRPILRNRRRDETPRAYEAFLEGEVYFRGRYMARASAIARVLTNPLWKGAKLEAKDGGVFARRDQATAFFPDIEKSAVVEAMRVTKVLSNGG